MFWAMSTDSRPVRKRWIGDELAAAPEPPNSASNAPSTPGAVPSTRFPSGFDASKALFDV